MEKKTKKVKPISRSQFNLVLGFFIISLIFALILDAGYLARTINFLPYFLLGYVTYIFYILIILKAVLMIFVNFKIKIKHKWFLLASLIVTFLGLSAVISCSMYDETSALTFSNLISKYNGYYSTYYEHIHVPFLFINVEKGIGGGFIGFLLMAIGNLMTGYTTGTLILYSFVIAIGIVIAFVPFIIDLIKLKKMNTKERKKEIKKQVEAATRDMNESDFYEVKDRSRSIIKSASLDDVDETNINIAGEAKERDIIDRRPPITDKTPLIFNDYSSNRTGGLTPAHFSLNGVTFNSHDVTSNDVDPMEKEANINIESNDVQNEVALDEIKKPIVEKKPEQMTLDFDKPIDKPDEDLLAVAPSFTDPVAKQNSTDPVINETSSNNVATPTRIKHKFIVPSLDLLNEYENTTANEVNTKTAEQRMVKINEILDSLKLNNIFCCSYVIGPAVTRYNIEYKENATYKQINGIVNDISIRIGGIDSRFDPIVPGQSYSGLEIPNAIVTTVGFKEVMEKLPPREEHPLALGFGKNIAGEVVWADLNKMPHMLISGTTGSGKSIFMHSLIMTLIMRNSPDDLRFVLIDPKRVELSKYKGMPHLLCPNITEKEEAVAVMNKLVEEMERRYSMLEGAFVNDIKDYNEIAEETPGMEKMPYYVAILDEYNDLAINAKEITAPVNLLSAKARACGIHLIIITQRPSTDVITGVIKSNLPTHVALMTASSVDSITIIGEGGAEKLLGKGDMLVQCSEVSKVGAVRLQSPFMQNKEILKVVNFLKSTMTTDYEPAFLNLNVQPKNPNDPMQMETGNYLGESKEKIDPRYEEVKQIVMGQDSTSISRIVREFNFGFGRAGKIFYRLVKEGIIEPPSDVKGSSKGSKVLIHTDRYNTQPDIGSDEVTTTETMDEYLRNSEKSEGGY